MKIRSRKIRLMRRRRRPRYMARRRTRSVGSLVKRRSSTEVKYFTYIDFNKAVPNTESATATSSLQSTCQFTGDIISNIVQGTGDNNRIGDKIYVKYVDFKVCIKPCLQSSAWQPMDFMYRVLVHNARVAAGVVVPNFWRGTYRIPLTHAWPDRSQHNIYYDRVITSISTSGQSPIPVLSSSPTGISSNYRYFRFRIPIGRQVTFSSTGTVKDTRDVLTFSVMGYAMKDDQDRVGWQTACMDYTYRIYFTDL